jgi:UDP-N-acetylmuramate dehydrogenase
VDEVIIATEKLERTVVFEGTTAKASSGVPISRFIRNLAESGLGGLEFAEGIPGTLGGAVTVTHNLTISAGLF